MKILCGKFSELRRHSLQLFYAIRDHPSTMLYNDEDLEVMFVVADSIGLNCIEVTVVDSHGFDSGTSGCGGDVGANSIGFFDSGGDVGASTSKGISFSGQGLVVHRLESMGDVGKEDDLGAVVHFLSELPNERWAKVFFPGQRYGAMSSSLAECFNSWILKERELPVLDMVDRIRKKMMKLMCLRRERASKWEQVICPYGESRLENLYDLVKTWKVIPSSADIFEVDTDPSVCVDIGRRTCSCCWWQLNGFPCCHAVYAIKYSGKDLNLYVERYFHVESYRQVYSKPIYPVASLLKGDVVDCGTSILPPLSKKPPGRLKKKRIRSNGEKVREMKCGRCGKMGNHNKLTCKEDLRPGF
ncbi:hypothetical protein RHGRI_001586 [Rhododendron griersonianum]|uniref:SWIM-type domain-containing protein n=1 Tax=Rhododendron griersonianum TaxID=479676 RepID=A0AAV6LL99_9ERIC|nr:hypothetical protein RHGRI_001586 [Rhododendron griersonianum]